MSAVIVDRLVKNYKTKNETVPAVKGISFNVGKGELFGIIGPDGAGKTSLFRMLTTLLLPDAGTANVDGSHIVHQYKDIRRKVGYMPGKFSLYQDLTIEENLHFFATIFNTTVAKNYSLIKDIYVQIEPFKDRKAGKLSGGMKQKLALCCALIHKPVVLFLDEPTTGVDAVSRKEFWDMLTTLKQQDITIIVSTPYMDEASLCDRIGLMQDGKLLTIGSPNQIIEAFTLDILAVKASNMHGLLHDLNSFNKVKEAYSFGEVHHAVMKPGYDTGLLQEHLRSRDYADVSIEEVPATIEDCFMQLMQER